MTFTLNPPRARRLRVSRRRTRSKGKRSASGWRSLVKRYGVMGAVKMRRSRRAAAKKATRKARSRKTAMARRNPVARRRRKGLRRRARRNRVSRRRVRRARRNPVGIVANPPKRRRRRRHSYRRNSWKGAPRRHARAAKKGWRRRRARRHVSRRRRFARRPYRVRRYYRRHRKLRGTRRQIRARRRNIRKALNKRFGARRWHKWSTAKWNPGFALSLGGVTRSITGVFSVGMLQDGLAIAGGIVGTLALPSLLQRLLPSALTSKVSLTTGWTGHLASFASAGLVGYAAGLVMGGNVGRKVLYGGLGAAVARLLLDKVPGLSARTGVTLSGNAELDKLIEQEIAAELRSGGGVGAYVTPGSAVAALPLGDYVGPRNVVSSAALGASEFEPDAIDEF